MLNIDNQPAQFYLLKNANLEVVLSDLGASVVAIKFMQQDCLLSLTESQWLEQNAYMGASVGRFANRIRGGKFSLDGVDYQISLNQNGNSLHGGKIGFSNHIFRVSQHDDNKINFNHKSPDGDQGFPGKLNLSVSYSLKDDQLLIEYYANCDKRCPINITNHCYFHLPSFADNNKAKFIQSRQQNSAMSHFLKLNSAFFAPVDDKGVSYSPLKPTLAEFDFSVAKEILPASSFNPDGSFQHPDLNLANGFDHSFKLEDRFSEKMQKSVAVMHLQDPLKTMELTLFTSFPALHIYTGNFLSSEPLDCGDRCAIALEPQFFANNPNDLGLDGCYVAPEQDFHQFIQYRFKKI